MEAKMITVFEKQYVTKSEIHRKWLMQVDKTTSKGIISGGISANNPDMSLFFLCGIISVPSSAR
ncbi:hypothetical protein, partial [Butyricicoccus sp.]|uniref:hypothetical protein n=1 Tax=Butyricicoccus sp. TaxID=2049021 RepID=UPI003735FDBA